MWCGTKGSTRINNNLRGISWAALVEGQVAEAGAEPEPNLKMAIEYAHHEGEMFIASVIHPFDDPILDRNSGFPLKLWEYAIYRNFGMVDGQRVLDMFGCREKCDGSRTCDCEYEFERWLTSWLWTCHFRSGLEHTAQHR